MELARSRPETLLCCDKNFLSAEEKEHLLGVLESRRAIVCDLGCGSGSHVLELARREPLSFHIGIELRYKRAFRCAEKAEKAGLRNAFFVRCDIRSFLESLPPGSISGFYLNFPDPWEKRRWEKHRFINREFVERLGLLLERDGFVSCKTDHSDYFGEIKEILCACGGFKIEKIVTSRNLSAEMPCNIPTEFELFFQHKGLSMSYLVARKITDPGFPGL